MLSTINVDRLLIILDSRYREKPELRLSIIKLLRDELSSRGTVSLEMTDVHPDQGADAMSQEPLDMDDMTLENVVTALANRVARIIKELESPEELPKQPGSLPQHIMFPYSRHSSYSELCALVEAFKPRDIYPCTTVPEKHWKANHSMAYLFGHLYSEPPTFSHDQKMLRKLSERTAAMASPRVQKRRSAPEVTSSPELTSPMSPSPILPTGKRKPSEENEDIQEHTISKRKIDGDPPQVALNSTISDSEPDGELDSEQLKHAFRIEASDAALGNFGMHWSSVGLVSVTSHQEREEEL